MRITPLCITPMRQLEVWKQNVAVAGIEPE